MKVSAVISEFNPIHKGHEYLFDCARKNGSTHIISIMSGNFVQRGDCAIYPKWDRAVDAVKSGVDLVIEIPSVKSCSSASNFAKAGVEIAEKCGCVDELFFGSECNNIDTLTKTVDILETEEFKTKFEEIYKSGLSYPSARQQAFEAIFEKDTASILDNPNDILGIEYIKSIKSFNCDIIPVCFNRIGEIHDSTSDCGEYLSSLAIREKILNGNIDSIHTIHSLKNIERALIYKLREMSCEELKNVPDVDEGLENRIKQIVNKTKSIEDILTNLKTKRYTYSRLRRIILCAFLNIGRDEVYSPISYIKVLAFNSKGRELLKIMKDTAKLPIIMKYSDVVRLSDKTVTNDYEKEIFCSDVYALTSDKIEQCGLEQINNAIYVG